MYTECKYYKGRTLPITISDGFQYIPGYFNLILLKQGYLSFNCGQNKIVCSGPSLICLSGNESVSIGALRGSVVSLSFASNFINVHLNDELINFQAYPIIAKEHLFPTFEIFLHRSEIYCGVLPLSEISKNRLNDLFSRMAVLLFEQPTFKWSCKARSELFLIFDIADFNMILLEKGNFDISNMLEAIHVEIDTNLSLLNMFKRFNTTAPTVSRKFKSHFGTTAIKYVLDLRLKLCSYVLAFTDINVNDIAVSYEFNDATYLARMFKKQYGISPYDFRTEKRIARDNYLH